MMGRCQKFFSLFTVLHLLHAKRFCAFVSDSLVSNSKQALTPKTQSLIFLVIVTNYWWRRLCHLHRNYENFSIFCVGNTIVLFPLTLFLHALLNSVCSPQRCSQDTCGPLFPCSSSSFLFSPAIFFTSFLPSLACPLQFVLFNIY